MKATIQKWGNSLALRIPKSVAQQIKVSEGDGVEIAVVESRLVVQPARRTYRLADLVEKITATNRHGETKWGKRVGEEAW